MLVEVCYFCSMDMLIMVVAPNASATGGVRGGTGRREEEKQKQAAEMDQMYNYIQTLSVQMGNPIPAMQFPVAPAPTTPPVSILKTL